MGEIDIKEFLSHHANNLTEAVNVSSFGTILGKYIGIDSFFRKLILKI